MRKKAAEQPLEKPWNLNPVWDLLTEEEKQELMDSIKVISFRKNQIIHKEGEASTGAMMLITGKIRLYKEGIGQKPQIIRLLKPYDVFGYRATIAEGSYNSSASAFEESTVYKIPKDTFVKLIKSNNQFCYTMMVTMAQHLATAEMRTVTLTQKHIRGRLAEALLALKKNYGTDADGVTIAIYISREDLANMSNMTTSNAIRTLMQFAEEGLIGVDGRKIRLLDEEQLIRISRLG